MANAIVIIILAGILFFACRKLYKNKKSGGSCGCSCGSCPCACSSSGQPADSTSKKSADRK